MGETTMIQTLSKRQAGRRKFGKALLLLVFASFRLQRLPKRRSTIPRRRNG
ncbi:hypothetical protein T190_19065 [Sinorhizobium meliloti CCBAU 01290]|nr:hypothetical protein T190_19065 [Sinorhizobium meliloti CCBAU 01290]